MSSFWRKWWGLGAIKKNMIKNYFQSAIKLTAILLLSVSSFISKSQNTNYFETSKNIEIFTDLYKELDMFYVDEVNSSSISNFSYSFFMIRQISQHAHRRCYSIVKGYLTHLTIHSSMVIFLWINSSFCLLCWIKNK